MGSNFRQKHKGGPLCVFSDFGQNKKWYYNFSANKKKWGGDSPPPLPMYDTDILKNNPTYRTDDTLSKNALRFDT